MLAFSFLAIAILGGFGLLGTGYRIGALHGRTTFGLVLSLVGLLVLVMSYGSAIEWGIITRLIQVRNNPKPNTP